MKKGQIQMMETVIVLFIFFIILAIALVFLFKFNNDSTQSVIQEYQQNDLYNFVLSIPNEPQLKCSFISSEEECMDTIKMLTPLKNLGNRKIEVTLIGTNSTLKCNSRTYPKCDTFILYDGKPSSNMQISTPVSLYYPITKEYYMGVLRITQ
jgi:hypothetical protein